MKKFLFLLVIAVTLSACYSSRSLERKINLKPMTLTSSMLTGLYENRIDGDNENSLWNDLCLHNPDKKQNIADGNQVFISFNNDREITAELYQENRLLDSMALKGKAKEKFFTIRKGSHFFTLILVTSIQSKKTILGNDANGDLLIAQGFSQNTMLLENELDDDNEVITGVYIRRGDNRPQRATLN